MITEAILRTIDELQSRGDRYDSAIDDQISVWAGRKPKSQPLLLHCALDENDKASYPEFNFKEIHFNSEKMFASQFRQMMTAIYGEAGAVPSVRANMGCGIFPTLFGIHQELFEDKMPWVQEHLSKEQLKKMGPEDLKMGDEFKAGLDHMAYMAERLDGTGCMVYPMDLQGAVDTAHLVYGDAFFYDLYDDPAFIHHLLNLCCEAIFMGMEQCFKVIPQSDAKVAHYNAVVMPRSKGGVKLSEDTSTLLSKEHIKEFVAPYMDRILKHFGGGYIHYCGTNPHLYEVVLNHPLVLGLNFGNPEKHEMDTVLENCAKAQKVYYGAIPNPEGLPTEEYFTRYLMAAKGDERIHLLLNYACSKPERSLVLEAWNRALQRVGF